ncbi:XdhC family protein [Burkholderia contaminans]|uniref:XdhC family protein n=1 Tax=Burkholderia contaminans TaxID=488447 RepID=UPI0021AB3122
MVFVELVRISSRLDEALEWVRRGRAVIRNVNANSGEADVTPTDSAAPTSFDGLSLRACYGTSHRMVIIGAVQLSEYVARTAGALGYRVIVCDPREEYLGEWSVAHTEVFREMPDDLIERVGLDPNTAVVALTHDPKIDDLALIEALKSPAFYVGAIGSRANNAKRRERLKLFDLTDTQIAAPSWPDRASHWSQDPAGDCGGNHGGDDFAPLRRAGRAVARASRYAIGAATDRIGARAPVLRCANGR